MKKTILTITFSFFLTASCLLAQKTLTVARLDSIPSIDGVLQPGEWGGAQEVADFTTSLPQFGNQPQSLTTVRMGYTDRGLFIAAVCKSAGNVRQDASLRDYTGTGDYFTLGLDTWNDDQNAFQFTVTAAGQMIEERTTSTMSTTNFNTRWAARTTRQADGWTLEMWIPFHALRYPGPGLQKWGIQFTRFDRSTGETSTWSPQHPEIADKVWQYGTLEGLNIPRKRVGYGLTLLGTTFFQQSSGFNPLIDYTGDGEIDMAHAADGRVQFNPSTTLDISIAPELAIIDAGLLGVSWDEFKHIYSNSHPIDMPGPRQLLTEEQGILAKTANYWNTKLISTTDLRARLNAPPTAIVYNYYPTRPVNELRFTHRTKSKVGISVSNTTFSRPEYYIYESIGFEPYVYTKRYPAYPVYNHIAVEKAYRNNSWWQVSTANFIAGKGLNTNNSAASFQWRDRSNTFEAGGHFLICTQFMQNNDLYSRAEGDAHIAKVNGKYLWSLGYQSKLNTQLGLLNTPTLFYLFNQFPQRFYGSITQQNFKPSASFFLKTRQTVSAVYYGGDEDRDHHKGLITWTSGGTDHHFREWAFSLSSSPFLDKETLDFGVTSYHGRSALPFIMNVSGSTDTRKPFILNYGTGVQWRPYFWNLSPEITFSPKWVIHKKLVLSIQNRLDVPSKVNKFLPQNSNNFVFERAVWSRFENQTTLVYMPTRKWTLNLGISYIREVFDKREAWQILETGKKERVDNLQLLKSNDKNLISNFDITWNYTSFKYIRFHINYYQYPISYFTGPGTLPITVETQSSRAEIAWVWNMFSK